MTTLDYIWILNMCHKIERKNDQFQKVNGDRMICQSHSRGILSLFVTLTLLPILALLVSPAVAQKASDGRDFRLAIRTGNWKPYKIAIGDFKVVGDWSLSADSLAAAVKKVVTDDLGFPHLL